MAVHKTYKLFIGRSFVRSIPASDGLLKSRIVPGLWLDPAALLRGEMKTVFLALRRGIESPEYAALVKL